MRLASAALGLPVALAALLFSLPAGATSLFWEDFEGYNHFPSQIPARRPRERRVAGDLGGCGRALVRCALPDARTPPAPTAASAATPPSRSIGGSTNPSRVARVERRGRAPVRGGHDRSRERGVELRLAHVLGELRRQARGRLLRERHPAERLRQRSQRRPADRPLRLVELDRAAAPEPPRQLHLPLVRAALGRGDDLGGVLARRRGPPRLDRRLRQGRQRPRAGRRDRPAARPRALDPPARRRSARPRSPQPGDAASPKSGRRRPVPAEAHTPILAPEQGPVSGGLLVRRRAPRTRLRAASRSPTQASPRPRAPSSPPRARPPASRLSTTHTTGAAGMSRPFASAHTSTRSRSAPARSCARSSSTPCGVPSRRTTRASGSSAAASAGIQADGRRPTTGAASRSPNVSVRRSKPA